MYIDRNINQQEYPYQGTFYTKGEMVIPDNGDLFGQSTDGGEAIILETACDVIETNRSFSSGAISAGYDVYFPHPEGVVVEIERGMLFRCNALGFHISGMVISIGASKRGGVHAYVKSTEI